MKNLKLLIFLFSTSVIYFSCGSDDSNDENSSNNVLIHGNTVYELKAGAILDYGLETEGIYNFDIELISTEVNSINGELEPIDEIFSGVYFELFTDNSENLDEGTYVFGNGIEVNSYNYGELFIEGTSEDDAIFDINSGSFTVLDNGSTYEFEFEGTIEGGTTFSGYYKGSLYAFDYSENLDRPATSASNLREKRRLFNN